jgi:glycogen debranching enzyme
MNAVTKGAPEPLGVTLDEAGANVAVFSAHADEIYLCLFDDADNETARIRLPARSGDVFHGHVALLREGQRYGLRACGPIGPGHRFNAAKLLIDPYALALDRVPTLHESLFTQGASADLDSGPFVAKGVMTWVEPVPDTRPHHAARDRIIYELNVKGFTAMHPDVPSELRGTFAGLAHEASIAHLKQLGVTTIECLPCAAWIDERHLPPLGLRNYWGYNPIAMMAPDPRLAPGGWRELRDSVATLHTAGLEVIFDVVFNHTGESDELGPTLSLRGLDNASYYRLDDDAHVNDAGCGNILAFDRAPVVRLAMDALRVFAIYAGVDGFRFDLATVLARRPDGFDPEAPFLTALRQDPVLRDLLLIAEPWDVGPGGYQLGAFPPPFAEWNDRYRDDVRRFWRGDAVGVSGLATRLAGSQDFFARRDPSKSVNFVVAHDGFTLRDLVSHRHKHNEANGEDNRDGTDENFSWSHGVEGDADDPSIDAARRRDEINLLATLLFSRGTPMLSMGSELGHTQNGNNNAYAQDNEMGWLDWSRADRGLIETTRELIRLRRAHPALRDDRFLDGAAQDDTLLPDVQWLDGDGAPMQQADWRQGDATTLVAALFAEGDRVLVILHRGDRPREFTLRPARDRHEWRVAFDSAEGAARLEPVKFVAPPRSVLLLVEERHAASPPRATDDAFLARLASAAGIATRWSDVAGVEHDAPRDTLLLLLGAMGLPAALQGDATDGLARLAEGRAPLLPSHLVARDSEAARLRLFGDSLPACLTLIDEDGGELVVRLTETSPCIVPGVDGRERRGIETRLPPLDAGRYVLRAEGGQICRLTVAPGQCHLPQGRDFGFSAQLYALRRDGDQGIGDFTTLARFAQESARVGGGLVAINPLHALFSQDRSRASPYYPSDRLFLDPIYIDLATLDNVDFDEAAARALSECDAVDYPAVHDLKAHVFEAAFARFDDLAQRQPDAAPVADFNRFLCEQGEALRRFALFEAIGETRRGQDWRLWPVALKEAQSEALACFAKSHEKRLRFHAFLQWLAERQFETAARDASLPLGFCRDLAVGAAPDGAESWRKAQRLLDGFSIGAPPDPFSREGQNWGLPALNPLAVETDGGADFAQLLRANMRHAGALRIDHVMGLSRLFLVPDGAKASEGAYVSYPLDALLAQLSLESARARCMVVGEDLGTLPWGFREKLDAANVLSYRVLWFEREGEGFTPPQHYPQKAMACVSTHDLPTLAGWRAGADIAEKEALGLLSADEAEAERATRRADETALLDALRDAGLCGDAALDDDALAAALHAFAASTRSRLVVAQLDDLAGERVAVNLPGTDRERPNWRRKLGLPVETIFTSARAAAIVSSLRRILVQIGSA